MSLNRQYFYVNDKKMKTCNFWSHDNEYSKNRTLTWKHQTIYTQYYVPSIINNFNTFLEL